MSKHLVAPSILAADFTNLKQAIEIINHSEADYVHVDVMDGVFVPNITFGMMIVDAVKKLATKPLDVHLMIVNPEKYIEAFREAGADIISVHYEACPHLHRVLQQIKATGAKAGVALNPHTSVHLIEDLLEDLDQVILMSVNPGFGGQKFIYRTIPRVKQLKDLITIQNTQTKIEIDGGVAMHNAEAILQAGADILVAGSSVFKAEDPTKAIKQLKSIGNDIGTFV
ncbi:MAG: ribulose-phosphate 3-epimerase [Bacteroidota bacterium]